MRGRPNNAQGPIEALLDAAVDAIVIIDESGLIQRFNRAAEETFGYKEAEVLGKNVSLLMAEPHSSLHDSYLKRYLDDGEARIIGRGREETGRRRNGELFPIHLSVGETRLEGEIRFIGFIRDLSEARDAQEQLRRLEEQLLHADRLVVLGELTAGIAHEINQPLTAIAAYADAGKAIFSSTNGTAGQEMQSICQRIGQQSRRAAEVVQRLRKLVRTGEVTKRSHDINKTIKNIILLFEYTIQKTGISVVFHPIEPIEHVYIDEVQIQQILVNLVKNSMDAIRETGHSDGRVDIRVRRDDGHLLISVEDNGPGVPEALRQELFEPFFTTKDGGVGLGLSICRTIAAAHGGRIGYTTREEGGARFTLSLPLQMIG